jgi:hypothetical protein
VDGSLFRSFLTTDRVKDPGCSFRLSLELFGAVSLVLSLWLRKSQKQSLDGREARRLEGRPWLGLKKSCDAWDCFFWMVESCQLCAVCSVQYAWEMIGEDSIEVHAGD